MPPRKKTVTTTTPSTEVKIEKPKVEKYQTSSLEVLRVQIAKEINTIVDLLISQINQFEQTKKQIQEEMMTKEKQNKQVQEEKQFAIMMDEKKKQAEFEERLTAKTKDFEEQKEIELNKLKTESELLEQKKSEFQSLKSQVTTFPTQLEKAVEEAQKEVASELKKEYDGEKKFLTQKFEYDLKLLQQQINNLQQIIKQQEKEIDSLQDDRTRAIEQINQLAVTVIKGKELSVPPTQTI